MSELDDAFEKIIMHKAEKMKKGLVPGSQFNRHIKNMLRQSGTNVCEEQVENFVMGAIDAMMYDVASLVGFVANTRRYDDWASCRKRQEMLKKIFPERTGKKLTS